jgi:hypothetical protein
VSPADNDSSALSVEAGAHGCDETELPFGLKNQSVRCDGREWSAVSNLFGIGDENSKAVHAVQEEALGFGFYQEGNADSRNYFEGGLFVGEGSLNAQSGYKAVFVQDDPSIEAAGPLYAQVFDAQYDTEGKGIKIPRSAITGVGFEGSAGIKGANYGDGNNDGPGVSGLSHSGSGLLGRTLDGRALEIDNVWGGYGIYQTSTPLGISKDVRNYFRDRITVGEDVYPNAMLNVKSETNTTPAIQVIGGVKISPDLNKPACDGNTRGTMWFSWGGTNVADALEICSKTASNVYSWVQI